MSKKQYGLMLTVAMLAGLVGGVVSSRVLMSTPIFAQKTPQQEKVIRAERFELVSKEGKTRAVLGERTLGLSVEDFGLSLTEEEKKEGEKPFPGLFLVDEEGKTRAVFGMRVTGPGLLLLTPRLSVSSLDSNSLSLIGPEGRNASLVAEPGGPYLRLAENTGAKLRYVGPSLDLYERRGEAHLTAGGKLNLTFYKAGSMDLDTRSLTIRDKDIKTRAALSVGTDGEPSLELYDENEKSRAVLGYTELEVKRTGSTEKRAVSSLVLFDKDGKVIWKAP